MKVLITGGAGFIGSHLTELLASRGDEVVVLDSLRTGKRSNLTDLPHEFIEGTIEDLETVERAAAGAELVFHLAAQVSVPESMMEPEVAERINVSGTRNVLEGARRAGVRKVVFSSTCAVYGSIEREVHREVDSTQPESVYAVSKLTGESYMNMYHHVYGLETSWLRSFNVYGPRQDPRSFYSGVVAVFSERARANLPLTIYGDGGQTRDFVYVGDVASAMVVASESGAAEAYNVCSGERITIQQMAETIRELTDSDSVIEYADHRPGDILHSKGDCSKLRAIGWEPIVSLKEGLSTTIQSFS